MAYVRPRRVFWELPPGATHGNLHIAQAGDANFLPTLTAAPHTATPAARVPAADPQEFLLGVGALPDGTYQFAVVAEDEVNKKWADPYQNPAWVSVPLDLSPLPPAFGGGFELL